MAKTCCKKPGEQATRQDRLLWLWRRLRLQLRLRLWSGLMDACLFTASLFVQFSVIAAVRCVVVAVALAAAAAVAAVTRASLQGAKLMLTTCSVRLGSARDVAAGQDAAHAI